MENGADTKLVKDLNGKKFFIPSYQRGYRWMESEVRALLDDIHEFKPDGKEKYCLQPLLVQYDKEKGAFAVVDGQQRLTTIFIIYQILKKYILPAEEPFELVYETRSESEAFLRGLCEQSCDLAKTNIDFDHIYAAWQCIKSWIEDKGGAHWNSQYTFASNLFGKLNDYTMFIWYEIQEDVDPIGLFAKENTGKIRLTSSELIKALLLSGDNFKKGTPEQTKLDRQIQWGTDWNSMERRLAVDSFWCFLSNEINRETRIDLVFETLAREYNGEKEDSQKISEAQEYFSFLVLNRRFNEYSGEKADCAEEIWRDVRRCFAEFEDWYDDFLKYHVIGYLIAIADDKNKTVYEIWESFREKKKSEILAELHTKVIGSLKGISLEKLEYGKHNDEIKKVLLLHNILVLLPDWENTGTGSTGRYHFPFDHFKKRKIKIDDSEQKWDIEHIHAVGDALPKKLDDVRKYFAALSDYFRKPAEKDDELKRIHEEIADEISRFIEEKLDSRDKEDLSRIEEAKSFYEKLMQDYKDVDELSVDNGLGNLALLDYETNRSYKNATFSEKREEIVKQEKAGQFIPLCTKNVFFKLYTATPDNLYRWTGGDRDEYFKHIDTTLKPFLSEGEKK